MFPPFGIIETVDDLRAAHDSMSAAICQAHVSLSEAMPQPLSPGQVTELAEALAGFGAFEVNYGPLRSFPPYPGVSYAIGPEEHFSALRTVIHSTSPFAGVSLTHSRVPHRRSE